MDQDHAADLPPDNSHEVADYLSPSDLKQCRWEDTTDHAGIAGLLGIARPSGTDQARLTLVAARCAEGINRPGAGYRVIHTLSGLHLGIVGRRDDEPGWCYVCPREGCEPSDFSHPDKHSAAIALSAHMLDHGLAMVRARLAGEQPKAAEAS